MKTIPQKHQAQSPPKEAQKKNKWVKFADEMSERSPLLGQSEEINTYVREFRDSFAFREE